MTIISPVADAPSVVPVIRAAERRYSHVLQLRLAAPRAGIMLHYDDSRGDDRALDWFADARCRNGYTWLVLRSGRVIELADPGMRTQHAGPCITPQANSVYYGIAAATDGLVPATDAQLASIVDVCREVFRQHRWLAASVETRIVGHDKQAVWTAAYTRNRTLWGKLGRKADPTGIRKDGRPIIDTDVVRRMVARQQEASCSQE